MAPWIFGRYGWIVPGLVFVLVITGTALVERQWRGEQEAARVAAERDAQEQVTGLADELGNTLAERLGSLAAAELRFTPVEDSVSERSFAAAVDSVTSDLSGLQAISVVYPEGRVSRGNDALLGQAGLDPATDTVVRRAFVTALTTREPSATGVIQRAGARRVFVFDPVTRGTDSTVAVLAAELDPLILYRAVLTRVEADTTRPSFYSLFGPAGNRLTTSPPPYGWAIVERPVRVADTQWLVSLAYPPPSTAIYSIARIATWITGLAVALALAGMLEILRHTVRRQRAEIARREEAERVARSAAAKERELSGQLAAAHQAAQQLATSLDPARVGEFFLGAVGEVLRADTATLYTFDDEGELLEGRSRIVFRPRGDEGDRTGEEDIREVRVPAALLPQLAEAVSSGATQVVEDARRAMESHPGVKTADAWVTLPLQVGGHMVGVAIWEVFSGARTFDAKAIAFAEALAAQASASLRAAELFTDLEAVSGRATWEAARFGAVLDQMADGVVILGPDGSVERSNAAAEEVLGTCPPSGDLREWLKPLDLTWLDRRPLELDDFPLMRAFRGERVSRVSFQLVSAEGGERFVSGSATPIVTPDGGYSGAAMVIRDVTDEQQYAEMLRHTNQELRRNAGLLEEANRQLREATAAKDQFLAVVSHELRTPVNAIMGYAELLELEIKGPINADQKQMVNRVSITSTHLLGLINEILDLAKVASGSLDLELERVDLREVVEGAMAQVEPLAAAKGLELRLRGMENGRALCLADRRRLTQAILNLLSNAVKFTDEGGVHVSVGPDSNGFVSVSVHDTGPGIPEDQQELIFREFYQVESGLTRRSGGTGLGLAITRKFTRLMGGDVAVQSIVGEGSQFTLRIPALS